ncbi:microtubule-associated protein Jupiter isoform X2 [Camponotus floridanus]|uniref:microtubule-associated protein Jupiter isoform X2 n=1 Tax=Camponotus floridanus TaxID=104421 RepID=UPI00059CC768|nr:microtubule-associated protein Jupiter isoform X2 [Camponotus floridanus]
MWAGQDDTQKFQTRVLKPPGGGSSDIFGAEETSPRRVKTHNQSQLGSALFGNSNGTENTPAVLSPRSNKPGNDSYNRLFGPPDALPTPNTKKNHKGNNILFNGEGSSTSTLSSSPAMSRAKSTISNGNSSLPNIANGFSSNGNNSSNDITAFRRKKRFRGLPTRNPVTGDGIEVTPVRCNPRKWRDGNPVTGTGYMPEMQKNGPAMQNGIASSNSSSSGEKSNETSPAAAKPRTRIPPGGYSSGLW